jgi:hypothetical protein
MFNRRHEKELAEIKAVMYEVGRTVEEVQRRLERIKGVQDRLAARYQVTEPDRPKADKT